ncbi:hypothetical protein H6G33_17905 [Calothrix sp. FACHB-1219]|uniref:hypothetical protein n=1 Tax=unclassified Calothrix TaxID=2619626 RepID=UPI0016872DAB|nr:MULTISPECIES: hypothetical protein [unclassified Calothrix]MBD2202754.1 hypothetical protein [Calothrix sp. FACHB-168]MBD2218907.1 hypothetical protein [Calothrix sp. FACHB-1219]
MTINLNLTGVGVWELTYFQRHVGDALNRRLRRPFIEFIELPYLTDKHIFLVGASYLDKPPTWSRAGYLYQQVDGIHVDDTVVFEGLGRVPTTEIDNSRFLIRLNTVQLIRFPVVSETFRLRFEPLPWIPQITLAVWEYVGEEIDSTEELIQSVRAKLETIEFKIDNL